MNKKLRLGIIGLGYWGPNLLRNIESLREYCSLEVLCDTNPSTLQKAYKGRNVRLTADYKEVCRDINIDAIIISTPPSTHYEIIYEALNNRKDVFCEKPLANNLKHAEEIVELTKKISSIVMVGHVFLYNPAVRELKKIIVSNELGDIYEINCTRKSHGPIRDDVNVLWDLAPHDISIILYLTEKKATKISAVGFNYLKGRTLEDSVDLALHFDNGIGAKINLSWVYPRKERTVTVVGSKKMAVFDDVKGNKPLELYEISATPFGEQPSYEYGEFKYQITDGNVILPKIDMIEPMKLEIQHFIDCITNRKTPLSNAENGRDVVKILEKGQEALKKSGWVEI